MGQSSITKVQFEQLAWGTTYEQYLAIRKQSYLEVNLLVKLQSLNQRYKQVHLQLYEDNIKHVLQDCLYLGRNIAKIEYHGDQFWASPFQADPNLITFIGKKCRNLRQLKLCNCHIGSKGVQLLKIAKMKFICRLDLCSNLIDEVGIKILSTCKFAHLRSLKVRKNKIRNKGILYLAKARWPKLLQLQLSHCSITPDGLKTFLHFSWPKICIYIQPIIYLGLPNFSSNSISLHNIKAITKHYCPTHMLEPEMGYSSWKLVKRPLQQLRLRSLYQH